VLVLLITVLGRISGAHLNPAVSLVFAARGELSRQILHRRPGCRRNCRDRDRAPDVQLCAAGIICKTAVVTFGLIATIFGGIRFQKPAIPWLVGLYITSAYWFTASTSFANPAVTIARA
jgi:glycerol uptake facilitator-like aquaporin